MKGTLRWVRRLQWPGAEDWKALPREPVIGEADKMEGYVKKNERLSLWWVNHAGHSVSSGGQGVSTESNH